MHPTKLIGALVVFVISEVRSQSGEDWEIYDSYGNIEREWPHLNGVSGCEPFRSRRCKEERYEARIKSHVLKYFGIRLGVLSDFKVRLPPDQTIDDTPPDFPELASQCPPGFQYANLARSCYKVVYEGHNWTSVDERCHDLHPKSHLVAITNSEENIGLMTYLKREFAKNSHINMCKRDSWVNPGRMLWTSGRQLNGTSCKEPFVWKIWSNIKVPLSSFTHWYPGEPNCSGNNEPCIHIVPTDDFLWNDIRCSELLCPLCEYDPM